MSYIGTKKKKNSSTQIGYFTYFFYENFACVLGGFLFNPGGTKKETREKDAFLSRKRKNIVGLVHA